MAIRRSAASSIFPCASRLAEEPAIDTSPASAGPVNSAPVPISFATRDGVTIHGDAWGSPDDPAVILVHGGGQTRHSWGGTAEALVTRGWYAVAIDQRGHGESDRSPAAQYDAGHFGADLADVVASFTNPPVVVGASLGGLAGLLVDGEYGPGTMAALVLVDITPRQETAGVDRIVGFMLDRAEAGFTDLDEVADAIAAYQPHRERPTNLEGLKKNLRHDPDGRWRWHWDPLLFNTESGLRSARVASRFEAAARGLTIPTLLVRGKMSDLVSEDTAREFLELVPHAQFVDVSDAGHMVAGDRNDRFTAAVVEFLEELQRSVE